MKFWVKFFLFMALWSAAPIVGMCVLWNLHQMNALEMRDLAKQKIELQLEAGRHGFAVPAPAYGERP